MSNKFFVSAIISIFAFFIFPSSVSAFEIGVDVPTPTRQPYFTSDNGIGFYRFEDVQGYYNGFSERSFISVVEDYYSVDLSEYYYFIALGVEKSRDRFPCYIGIFSRESGLSENTLFLYPRGNTVEIDKTKCSADYSLQGNFPIKSSSLSLFRNNPNLQILTNFAYANTMAFITNIPSINYDGSLIQTDFTIDYSLSVSEDYTCSVSAVTNSSSPIRYHVNIYNQNSNEPSEATHIPYSVADDFGQTIDCDNPGLFKFNLQDFRDKCSDFKSFSEKIIISAWCSGDNGIYDEKFFFIDLNDPFTDDNPNKALFAEKKDYIPFPSIDDYLVTANFPDIRDYVDFGLFDDADSIADYIAAIFKFLWSCVSGFFKWLWAVLKYIFFNFVGLAEWLGACLWAIVENIVIALYNLCVDIRRLLIYLFIPERDDLDITIKKKCPALTQLHSAITAGKNGSSAETSVIILGHEVNFNFGNIPDTVKNYLFTGSTICLYVIQAFVIVRCFFKMFAVNFGETGGDPD